jgi:type IV pilus assembly protein PilE
VIAVTRLKTGTHRERGITLLELMIVIAIVGILAAIAFPSYNTQVEKTRRADGKSAVLGAAQALERCRTQFGAYNNGACPDFNPAVASGEGFYAVSLPVITATTFTVTATAQGAQLNDDDCRTMSIDHLGAQTATTSGGAASAECW